MAQLEKDGPYKEYDRISLCNDGVLKKPTVDLNNYLVHNKMVHCLKLKKTEKVRIIQGHIASTRKCEDGQYGNSSVSFNGSDDDIVPCDTNMSDDQQSTDTSENNAENLFAKNKKWKNSYKLESLQIYITIKRQINIHIIKLFYSLRGVKS